MASPDHGRDRHLSRYSQTWQQPAQANPRSCRVAGSEEPPSSSSPSVSVLLFMLDLRDHRLRLHDELPAGDSQGAAEGAEPAPSRRHRPRRPTRPPGPATLNEALSDYGITCTGTAPRKGPATVGTCGVTIAACVGNTANQARQRRRRLPLPLELAAAVGSGPRPLLPEHLRKHGRGLGNT